MDDLLLDFVTESQEHLETIEDDFVMLVSQKDDPDPELVNKVFRAIHTIKGTAGFVGQKVLGELAHVMESVLQQIKVGEKKPEQHIMDELLAGVDMLKELLADPMTSNDRDISDIRSRIESLLKEGHEVTEVTEETAAPEETCSASETPETEKGKQAVGEPEEPQIPDIPELEVTPEMVVRFTTESIELLDQAEQCLIDIDTQPEESNELISEAFRLMHSFKGNCGFFGFADFEHIGHAAENVLAGMRDHAISSTPDAVGMLLKVVDHLRNTLQQYTPDSTKTVPGIQGFMDLLEEMMPDIQPKGKAVVPAAEETSAPSLPEKEPVQPVPAEKKGADKPEEQPETQRKAASIMQGRQDIRVDLSKLDSLINLVGELVIAETMVVRHPSMQDLEDESLERAIHQLERVSSDLQDVAMSVRMIPLATTFKKMTRLVYDLSRKSGKKIDLKLVGEDTEVDKTVIEHIGDPLVHIVRNAIDHGLESPEARREAGKPETGTVTIEARHEGGEVWIIISDDGRGLSREKILDKARSRGLVHGNGNDLRDEEVFKLVFEPGFSTAEKVTDISGRGVGMDVVKKNIEKLNGRVGVRSRPGQGSDFTLHIPLTLAIIDGMLVRVGDTQYAIPLLSIRESFRPTLRQITRRPDGQETVRVREEILPVLRLHEIFGKQPDTEDLCEGILVIVEADGEPVCLFVDELTGQQQTVIKGLSSYMGRVNGISGCTISGAGDVSLILDVGSLIRKAKETAAAMA